MFRRSSNNTFIPLNGLNGGSFAKIGNSTDELGERYPGLLGSTLVVDDGGALKYSNTTIGTLRNGVYQLVKFSGAATQGQLVYWDTNANNGFADFEVTGTATATTCFKAGIALYDVTSTQVTNGAYGWIQVAGLASVKFGSVTSGVIGNLVLATSLTAGTADAIADATAAGVSTAGDFKRLIGIAYEQPVSNTTKLVALNLAGFYQNIA